MQKKKQGKNSKKTIKKILIIVLIILVIVFILLLIIQSGIINNIKNISREPVKIIIEDVCTVYFGSILHDIKNEAYCKIKCTDECKISEMNFFKIEFIEYQDKCNVCDCYCKY
jgi:hypothetical protein